MGPRFVDSHLVSFSFCQLFYPSTHQMLKYLKENIRFQAFLEEKEYSQGKIFVEVLFSGSGILVLFEAL